MKTILEIIKEEEETLNKLVEREYSKRITEQNNNINLLQKQISNLTGNLLRSENKIDENQMSYSKAVKYKNLQSTRKFILWFSPFVLFIILINFWGILWSIVVVIFSWIFIITNITHFFFPDNAVLNQQGKNESLKNILNEIEKHKKIVKQTPIEIASSKEKLQKLESNPIRKENVKNEILLNLKKVRNLIDKWIGKNLDIDRFRNGDTIPHAKTDEDWKKAGENRQPAWCYYNNDPVNREKYGKLYNWYAVNDTRGLAPEGWHIPNDIEWTELENLLADNGYNYDGTIGGGRDKIAKALASTSGWNSSSITGAVGNTDYPTYRNKSGFTALPGGSRGRDGSFDGIGYYGLWWSATERYTNYAWARDVDYSYSTVGRDDSGKELGFSVRCLRD
jgi:uncharacterized protein (TIGR02145 family)